MSHVFHRNSKSVPPSAVLGDGIFVIDQSGKSYLDASGGAAVSCLGHSHPKVIEAIKAQLDELPYAHTGFFTSEPAEQLADLLVGAAPGNLDRVYIVSGGSEAIEAALKLARQYSWSVVSRKDGILLPGARAITATLLEPWPWVEISGVGSLLSHS